MPVGSPKPVRLDDEVLEILDSGVFIYVATRDAQMEPELVWALGLRVHADRRTVTLYLPTESAGPTLANAKAHGMVAATFCRPSDDRTVQLKGTLVAVRDSGPEDRSHQEQCRGAFVEQFAIVGIPRSLTRGLRYWPSMALDILVSDVYTQTPGPNAGARLSG